MTTDLKKRITKLEKYCSPKDGGINSWSEYVTAMLEKDYDRLALNTPYLKKLRAILDEAIPDSMLEALEANED